MTNYELPLAVPHEQQTEANDCCYARIQLLNSWRHHTKTKSTGVYSKWWGDNESAFICDI